MPVSRGERADKKRLVQIEWRGSYFLLPPELAPFELSQVERSNVYEVSFYYLNSPAWTTFKTTMADLIKRGLCRSWQIINLN